MKNCLGDPWVTCVWHGDSTTVLLSPSIQGRGWQCSGGGALLIQGSPCPEPQRPPHAPMPASALRGYLGSRGRLWAKAGSGHSCLNVLSPPRAQGPDMQPLQGNFPSLMLRRKFHFPVSNERLPFGLEKLLPSQHLWKVVSMHPSSKFPCWHLCSSFSPCTREKPGISPAMASHIIVLS